MNIQRIIFSAVVAIVFLFAGYNLYSYFSSQSELQAQKILESERQATERERQRTAEVEARKQTKAEELRKQQERDRQIAEQKAQEKAERDQQNAKRQADREKAITEEQRKEEARLQARIEQARTPKHIEGLPIESIKKFNSISGRYIRDHPTEFLPVKFSDKTLHPRRIGKRLLKENTNPLMLYAAISEDLDILQALLDIGLGVNSTNKAGYTPLMFASAYNKPEVISFLIQKGADVHAKAYAQNMNAMHMAALFNPKPDVINTLINSGLAIDTKVESGFTPLLLAASDNVNLEVVGRLAAQGADKDAYDNKGQTALSIVEARIRGEGDLYFRISKERNQQILDALK